MPNASTLTPTDRKAVAWHALSKVAPKRGPRDVLVAGEEYRIDLELTGKIGRGKVEDCVHGVLHVGADQLRAQSVACDAAELLAAIAGHLMKPQRDKLFQTIRDRYRETKSVRTDRVSDELVAECQQLLDELRDSRTVTQRGNVRFVSDDDAASGSD